MRSCSSAATCSTKADDTREGLSIQPHSQARAPVCRKQHTLKCSGKAEEIAAGGCDGAAGEESGEVDNVEAIVEVFNVSLETKRTGFFFVEFQASGNVDGESGANASVGEINTVHHLLTILGEGLSLGSGESKWQATAVFCATGNPNARSELTAQACPDGVALILGVWKMAGELSSGAKSIVAQEQFASDWEPDVPNNVGIAEEAGEAIPVRQFELGFRAVDNGFPKCDRKTDGSAENLIVVGKIVDITPEVICIEAQLVEEALGRAKFEIVAVRRLDRQTQNIGIQNGYRGRTGEKNIFKGRSLKDAIVGSMNHEICRRKITRRGQSRADGVLVHDELVMVPAKTRADGPPAETN